MNRTTDIDFILFPEITCDLINNIELETIQQLLFITRYVIGLHGRRLDHSQIDEVILKNNDPINGFFGVENRNNKIIINIPPNIKYHSDLKEWDSPFDFLSGTIKRDIKMTNDEIIFVMCHEMNHYLNNDVNGISWCFRIAYGLSANYLTLAILGYYAPIYLIPSIGFNHAMAYQSRLIEKRADLQTLPLRHDMHNHAISFFEKMTVAFDQEEDSTLVDIFMQCRQFFNQYIFGHTHPRLAERISYMSNASENVAVAFSSDKNN